MLLLKALSALATYPETSEQLKLSQFNSQQLSWEKTVESKLMLLNPAPQAKIEHWGKQQLSNETTLLKALASLNTYPTSELQLKLLQFNSQQFS